MLSKSQANVAADVLIEANKPTSIKKTTPYKLYKYRAIGGVSGLFITLIISPFFDFNLLPYTIVFIGAGVFFGERLARQCAK
jgi:uncharacterized membrane protein